MSTRKRAVRTDEVEVEAIPDYAPSSKAWAAWCEAHGLDNLGSSRRAWCTSAGTYLRGADYLVYYPGGDCIIDVVTADEVRLVE